ncbi:MAG TPA: hypothetical protein VGF79_10770 [Bacteroidia bacterium]
MNKKQLNSIASKIKGEMPKGTKVYVFDEGHGIEIQFDREKSCDHTEMEYLLAVKTAYRFRYMITGVPFEATDPDDRVLTITLLV